MRIIDTCDKPIRTVAVSPDGRFVAASADRAFGVFHWASGDPVLHRPASAACSQFAFAPDGGWVAYVGGSGLRFDRLDESIPVPPELPGTFAGGVAVSADGKKFVAVQASIAGRMGLAIWDLPKLRPQPGFNDWPPFQRLGLSRNGEFLAGIWSGVERRLYISAEFELRFAKSGGLDYRHRPFDRRPTGTSGFVSFTHDSAACAFGWDTELRVLDLSTGTSKVVRETPVETRRNPPDTEGGADGPGDDVEYRAPYRDAAFTGSGRHLVTIEQPDRWKRWYPRAGRWRDSPGTDPTCVLKLWDVRAWQVVREYDWQCGPLTCLAFTADGSAGVCGTASGKLVQFDVDE